MIALPGLTGNRPGFDQAEAGEVGEGQAAGGETMIAALALVATLLAARSPGPLPVWIDSDAALGTSFRDVDDVLALLQVFASPELEPVGISVTYGNIQDVASARRRLVRMTRRFGPDSLAVYAGATGADDLGLATLASAALAAALQCRRLTVLMLGPATTVATVLRGHPELAGRIERIVAVAGRRPGERFRPGKGLVTLRDLNFDSDPAAFRVLLEADVPLVLIPYSAGHRVWIAMSDLDSLARSGPAGRWLAHRVESRRWMDLWVHLFGVTAFNPFDSAAVAYLTSPELFRCERAVAAAIVERPDDRLLRRLLGRRKPYLLVSDSLRSPFRVEYCGEVRPAIKQAILERIKEVPA